MARTDGFRFNIGQEVSFAYAANGSPFGTRDYAGVVEGYRHVNGINVYVIRVGRRGTFEVAEHTMVAAPKGD